MDGVIFSPSAAAADIAPEPCPEITPCIAELLRTRYNPQHLLLRIERVIEVPVLFSSSRSVDPGGCDGGDIRRTLQTEAGDSIEPKESTLERKTGPDNVAAIDSNDTSGVPARHCTFRLFLSDSEYLIQALLKRELHHFVSMGEIVPGNVIKVEAFELRWADRIVPGLQGFKGFKGDEAGREQQRIAFLAVERFRTIWRPERRRESMLEFGTPFMKKRKPREAAAVEEKWHKRLKSGSGSGGAGIGNLETKMNAKESARSGSLTLNNGQSELEPTTRSTSSQLIYHQAPENNAGNFFQGLPVGDVSPSAVSHSTQDAIRPQFQDKDPSSSSSNHFKPIPSTPNLHTLSTLLNPTQDLPKRNYIVSVLAIVSSISPHTRIPPPHTRLPPKRDMRIVDPSLPFRSSGVNLSVFVDAENFLPPAGTAGLFVGLKTHEWEGMSLNAFEAECGGREWFVNDEKRLEIAGYDILGLKSWWEKRSALLSGCTSSCR